MQSARNWCDRLKGLWVKSFTAERLVLGLDHLLLLFWFLTDPFLTCFLLPCSLNQVSPKQRLNNQDCGRDGS